MHAVYEFHMYLVEDLERNDGKDRPYFMGPELQKVMDIQSTPVDHKQEEGEEEEDTTPLVKEL